jgi:hypothetical protein
MSKNQYFFKYNTAEAATRIFSEKDFTEINIRSYQWSNDMPLLSQKDRYQFTKEPADHRNRKYSRIKFFGKKKYT